MTRERVQLLLVAALSGLIAWGTAKPSEAAVQRFALLIGNNRGHNQDVSLRYAESDAARLSQVLRDIGGFEPADIVLLKGEDSDTTRRTLISLNDRIRAAEAVPGNETLLFVYYSGHADATALRLGNSRLRFIELAQLVRGSAAKFRLLVVDACRSGVLTRVKGGKIVAPFAVGGKELSGEGMAFLTASSSDEDAQESDELQASFFSHGLISGLLGAADEDADGIVSLSEAYRYTYDFTLRATSRTFAGTQHPTFRYDVKGHGAFALTHPGQVTVNRARLLFPEGTDYLVMADSAKGRVIGEVGASDPGRGLNLPPGRYFVRGRGRTYLQEGEVLLGPGQVISVDPTSLKRVEYARLVRKRGGEVNPASSIEFGLASRFSAVQTLSTCTGPLLGYRRDYSSFGLGARLGFCSYDFSNSVLKAHNQEWSLSVGLDHTWDLSHFSVAAGGGLGARLLQQSFETNAQAPDRSSLTPLGYLGLGVTLPLTAASFAVLDSRVQGHLYRYQRTGLASEQLRATAAFRVALVYGVSW